MPRQDLAVLITDNPENIHKRKSQLNIQQIQCHQAVYGSLVKTMGANCVVRAEVSVEKTGLLVAQAILDAMPLRSLH